MIRCNKIIIVFFALLAFTVAIAQPQRHDSRQQEYIYQTDDHKIEESIASVCHDSLTYTIVSQAIGLYLDNTDNMLINWNGIRTELPKAKKEAENLEKQIQNMNNCIQELSDVDEDNKEREQRWTNQQLDSLRKELEDSLSRKQKTQKEINESNSYLTHYNKWVKAQNKYMAKYQPNIEKSLDDLLEEANQLMVGKYSKTKNGTLVGEIQDRFSKDKRAKNVIILLERQEKAKKFLTTVCKDLCDDIDDQDIDYLLERQKTYTNSYGDSYKMFNEAFKKLESELEMKKLTVEKVDRILKETIDNE